MQIEVVAVGGTRPAVAEILQRALKLAERPEVRTKVNIRVEEMALEQKTIVVRRFLIEDRLVVARRLERGPLHSERLNAHGCE